MSRRRLLYSFVALSLAVAAPAFAAQGGNGGGKGKGSGSGSTATSASTSTSGSNSPSSTSGPASGTITLDAPASYGQTASFTATDPPVKYTVEASVACEQNGQTVFAQAQDMAGASPYHPSFTLWSPTWAARGGGSASCVAQLYYFTWKGHMITGYVVMANTSFTAAG